MDLSVAESVVAGLFASRVLGDLGGVVENSFENSYLAIFAIFAIALLFSVLSKPQK
jgi:hypothetical protein